MPRVRIVHLSDLHERVSLEWMSEKRKAKVEVQRPKRFRVLGGSFWEILQRIVDEEAPDLLVFTGDLADWGIKEEYHLARSQLLDICSRLNLGIDRLFLVPGNHDIQRTAAAETWKAMRAHAEIHPREIGDWLAGLDEPIGAPLGGLDLVSSRQLEYQRFLRSIGREVLVPGGENPHPRLGYRCQVELKGKPPIYIVGLDTAWLAGDDNDMGRLLLSDNQILLNCTGRDGRSLPGLRLALMHHPLSHLADGVHSGQLLSEKVDLVLHGHQHHPGAYDAREPDRNLRTLAAGSLYEGDAGDRWINSFNVVDIEVNDKGRPQHYDVQFFAWSPSGHWHPHSAIYRNAEYGRLRWPTVSLETDFGSADIGKTTASKAPPIAVVGLPKDAIPEDHLPSSAVGAATPEQKSAQLCADDAGGRFGLIGKIVLWSSAVIFLLLCWYGLHVLKIGEKNEFRPMTLNLYPKDRRVPGLWNNSTYVDQNGVEVSPDKMPFRLKLLTFSYSETHCVRNLEVLSLIKEYLSPYISLEAIVVSFDERDDAPKVAKFLSQNGYKFTMLVGNQEVTSNASARFGNVYLKVAGEKGEVSFDHSVSITMIDGKRMVGMFRPPFDPKGIAGDVLDYVDFMMAKRLEDPSSIASVLGISAAWANNEPMYRRKQISQGDRDALLDDLKRKFSEKPGKSDC